MQHYSSNFQILSKEKEHVHPPSCLWVTLLSRPVPVHTNPSVWAFLKSRCTLFSCSSHFARAWCGPWLLYWGCLSSSSRLGCSVRSRPWSFYSQHPWKQSGRIWSWGFSLGRVGCLYFAHSTCPVGLAGVDAVIGPPQVVSVSRQALRMLAFHTSDCSFLLSFTEPTLPALPSARPRAGCEETAGSKRSAFGPCLPGAHGSFARFLCASLHVQPFPVYSWVHALQQVAKVTLL